MNRSPWLSWEFCVLKVVLFAMLAFLLDKPVGSIAGNVSLEKGGFALQSFDLRDSKVYVLAVGRGRDAVDRGVWVKPDGGFRLDQLPVGEYSLTIRAAGYGTEYRSGVFVKDGQVTKLKDRVAMSVLQPSVNIASRCRVFTEDEPPHFWINASASVRAEVKLYRKDLLPMLKGAESEGGDEGDSAAGTSKQSALSFGNELNVYRSSADPDKLFGKLTPAVTLTRKLDLDAEDWARAEFKLSDKLQPGDYFAVVRVFNAKGDSDWNVAWFSVSNLGLIVKEAPDKTLVRAIDLRTLKPRAGVDVKFMIRGEDPFGSVKTKADGFAEYKLPAAVRDNHNYNLVCYATQGEDRAYNGLSFYQSDSDRHRTYFYTERPVYRLGQTVYYKGLCRYLEPKGLVTPRPGTSLSMKIEDPDNVKLWEGSLKLNNHGSFNGLYTIPADGKTGAYQVTIEYPDGSSDYERFEVAQYRKPEYQVEVVPLTPRVVAGQPVRARVKAAYYFGAPVENARVKYTIYKSPDWASRWRLMPRPDYYSYFDDWSDSDTGYYPSSGGTYVSEGYAQTDAAGEALVEFTSDKIEAPATGPYGSEQMDQQYRIEAEVTDISRMSVIGSASTSVTAGDFALFVESRQYVLKAGEAAQVEVTALDYDGQPVANQDVGVSLSRYVYDRNTYEYKGEETADKTTVRTDAQGKAMCRLKASGSLPSDTYYITVESSDKSANLIHDETSLWVASTNYPYALGAEAASREPLTVKLDKPVYRAGETARLMITAPVTGKEGAQAIVAIEGTTIHQYKVVDLKATAELVELPLTADYAPNVFATVTFVSSKHQFYSQEKIVKVSPEEHFLKLAVETDKPKYKPGESVTYKIKALNAAGKPVPGVELSLGVVDESIYAIRPETAANINRFFYNQRSNWVVTGCSFPEQYSGGPDKIEPRVRKDFRDTAAWLPALLTDRNGLAVATVKLPDNLTTWRATVRGITTGCDVGFVTNKVISTQDMILRLALPRFFSEGDEGVISAIVHNYTDKPQQVQVDLTASNQFQFSEPLSLKVAVEADKATRHDWAVRVVGAGEAKIFARAVGQTAGDALERTLPVRPLGLPAFSVKSGLIADDPGSATLPVGLPGDASPGTEKFTLNLASSTIGPVLGNFQTLIEYPYGCTEQTMSRLMPSVVAVQLHQKLGVALGADQIDKFAKVYRQALKKLTEYQHSDGGWGWWQNDTTSPYLTSLVMEGFHWLKQSGYKIDDAMVKTGAGWLKKSIPDLAGQLGSKEVQKANSRWYLIEKEIDLTRMIYSASLYGQRCPAPTRDWLLSRLNELPPEALTYLTLALHNSADDVSAGRTYKRLIELANQPDGLTNWDHTAEMWKRFGDAKLDYIYSYRLTGVETTALALRAVVAMDGANVKLIEAVKQWILLQRDQNGWENTKTTAQVFVALMEEEIAARSAGAPGYRMEADMGGKTLVSWLVDQASVYGPEKVVAVPLPSAAQELVLKKNGPGRLYYTSLLTYFKRLKPSDRIAEKSSPAGIHLKRQFFRLKPSAVDSEGRIHFETSPLSNNEVKAGETLLMKLSLDTPVSLPYVIVEAALPSGGEVVEDTAMSGNVENESNFFEGDWGRWWWTHQDVLDDRLVFFVTDLPAGKCDFHTLVRMEMPGKFQVNPVSLEGMYSKHVRAYSVLDSLTVTEGK